MISPARIDIQITIEHADAESLRRLSKFVRDLKRIAEASDGNVRISNAEMEPDSP